jgi:choline-phosphate cytidylyltransferase
MGPGIIGMQSKLVQPIKVSHGLTLSRHALQLRQAKLSFPSVRLIVGVFSDELCNQHGSPTCVSHVERCEVVRHCRWVDEVITDAPWVVDESFIVKRKLDYVAVQVGASVDPAYHRDRLDGYDFLKRRGAFLRLGEAAEDGIP